jgi:hypothetical protein
MWLTLRAWLEAIFACSPVKRGVCRLGPRPRAANAAVCSAALLSTKALLAAVPESWLRDLLLLAAAAAVVAIVIGGCSVIDTSNAPAGVAADAIAVLAAAGTGAWAIHSIKPTIWAVAGGSPANLPRHKQNQQTAKQPS